MNKKLVIIIAATIIGGIATVAMPYFKAFNPNSSYSKKRIAQKTVVNYSGEKAFQRIIIGCAGGLIIGLIGTMKSKPKDEE